MSSRLAGGLTQASSLAVQPDNLASVRVATRIGMAHEFDTTGRFGEQVAVYRLLIAGVPAARIEFRPGEN